MSGLISDERLLLLDDLTDELIDIADDKGLPISQSETLESIVPKFRGVSSANELEKFMNNDYTTFENNTITKIKPYAFYQANINEIKSESVLTIGTYAFRECTATKIYLPNANYFVTQLIANNIVDLITGSAENVTQNLQQNALSTAGIRLLDVYSKQFGGAYDLSSANPSNVPEIIIIRSTSLQSLGYAPSRYPNIKGIYVPNDLVNSYKTATNWSTISNIIIALEGSRYESKYWNRNLNSSCTLDGNLIEVLDNETADIFKHTENLSHIYENGTEVTGSTVIAGKTLTSTV